MEKYVCFCKIWLRIKIICEKLTDQLHSLSVSKESWKSVSTDYIVKLSKFKIDNEIYESIWVIIDWFIKQVHFIPTMKTIKKCNFVKLYLWEILKHHEISNNFISDRGQLFNNELMKDICQKTEVIWNLLTLFHSETDEQMKNLNQMLEQYL